MLQLLLIIAAAGAAVVRVSAVQHIYIYFFVDIFAKSVASQASQPASHMPHGLRITNKLVRTGQNMLHQMISICRYLVKLRRGLLCMRTESVLFN